MGIPVSKCIICDDILRNHLATYCRRCGNIMAKVEAHGKADVAARVAALRNAWDEEDECFRCYYSGIRLNDDDPRDPRYVTLELTALRKGAELVVTAALIHEMKGDLSEEEFKKIVTHLAKHFMEGMEVEEEVFKVKHRR